ncbi:hypothetical protein [Vibrio lamellibrachiae]
MNNDGYGKSLRLVFSIDGADQGCIGVLYPHQYSPLFIGVYKRVE